MALQDIINSILEDSKKELKAIQENAKKELETRKEKVAEKADLEAEKLERKYTHEAEIAKNTLLTKANLSKKEKLLQLKQNCLNKVFDEAKNRLGKLSIDEYKALLRSILKDAENQSYETISIAKGKGSETEEVLREFNISAPHIDESLDSVGGCVFTGNKIEVNATFENLLNKEREIETAKVATILFSEK